MSSTDALPVLALASCTHNNVIAPTPFFCMACAAQRHWLCLPLLCVLTLTTSLHLYLFCSGLCFTETLTKLKLNQVDLGRSGWAALLGALTENVSIKTLKCVCVCACVCVWSLPLHKFEV